MTALTALDAFRDLPDWITATVWPLFVVALVWRPRPPKDDDEREDDDG